MSLLKPVASYAWGGLAAAALIAAQTAFSTGYHDPALPKWFGVIVVAVAAMIYLSVQSWKTKRLSFDRYDLMVFSLLGYAAVSLWWSSDPLTGAMFLAKFGLFVLIFKGIKDVADIRMLRGVCWLIALSAVVVLGMAWQLPATNGGFYNQNYATEYLLTTLPFIAILGWEGRWVLRIGCWGLVVALLVYLFGVNPSKIEFLVVPAGLMLLLVLASFPSWVKWVGVGMGVAVGGAALYWGWDALAASKGFKDSVGVRLWLDIDTILMWFDNPIWGNGAGSFEALFPLYQERGLRYITDPTILANISDGMQIPGAAHNDVLQLLGDFGVLGVMPAVLFFYWLLGAHIKQGLRSPWAWAGLGGVAMTLPNMLINFPLQNPATATMAALACGFLANRTRQTDPALGMTLNRPANVILLAVAIAVAMGLGVASYRWHRASLLMHDASGVYRMVNPERTFRLNQDAYQWFPLDRTIRTSLAISLSAWMDSGDAEPLPPQDIDRVFRISMNGGQYVSGMLVARVLYLLNSGRYLENKEETERLLAVLKRSASQLADTYHLEALLGVLTQDYPRARAAIAKARAVPNLSYVQAIELDRLEATLGD